jgi:hypothetical protein
MMDEDGQDARGKHKRQEIVISGQSCNVSFLNADSALQVFFNRMNGIGVGNCKTSITRRNEKGCGGGGWF